MVGLIRNVLSFCLLLFLTGLAAGQDGFFFGQKDQQEAAAFMPRLSGLKTPKISTNTYHFTGAFTPGPGAMFHVVQVPNTPAPIQRLTAGDYGTDVVFTVSNLVSSAPCLWSVSAYDAGSNFLGSATWSPTNYAAVLYSTNVLGPWVLLPQVTFTNPPATGFLWWTNYLNWVARKD